MALKNVVLEDLRGELARAISPEIHNTHDNHDFGIIHRRRWRQPFQ